MGNLPEKAKNKKRTTRVIVIVLVSISFLIVALFMVMIQLTKPKAMILSLPQTSEKINPVRLNKDDSKIITILLGENNRVIYYMGPLGSPIISPKETEYGKNGIHRELSLQNKNALQNSSKNIKPKSLVIIIKPSEKSTYKNLTDIIDEMSASNIDNYVIVKDFTSEEKKLLVSK
jgi:biopolymer transport protein ExbD